MEWGVAGTCQVGACNRTVRQKTKRDGQFFEERGLQGVPPKGGRERIKPGKATILCLRFSVGEEPHLRGRQDPERKKKG